MFVKYNSPISTNVPWNSFDVLWDMWINISERKIESFVSVEDNMSFLL